MTGDSPSTPDPISVIRSRRFLVLLVLAGIVGVVASLAAWCVLELINEVEDGVYSDLPDALGFDSRPVWWPLPVLAIAGLIVAFAIAKLPGRGGHVPAKGLNPSPTAPIELPGVIVAAAPASASGPSSGRGAAHRARRRPGLPRHSHDSQGCPPAGAIAGRRVWDVRRGLVPVRLPLIAAVLLIEATGLGGPRRTLILIPGLLASGIGTLVSIGLVVDRGRHCGHHADLSAAARLHASRHRRLPLDGAARRRRSPSERW